MISILEGYIKLRGVNNTITPTSGRYLNELPGISTDKFKLVKHEEDSLIRSWEDIERRSIRLFENKLYEWGAEFYKNYGYIENVTTSQYTNDTQVPAGTTLRGWKFVDTRSSLKSRKIHIQSVDIYSESAVSGDIFIYETSSGRLLDTITKNLTVGVNTIVINKEYEVWRYPNLFICYDSAQITSRKAQVLPFGGVANMTQGQISNSATVLKDSITGVDSTGQGINLTYSLACSFGNFVSQRLQLFEEPFMRVLGWQFFDEALYSDQINRFTLLSPSANEKRRDEFKMEFEEMMDGILKSIPVDFGQWDFCFKCDREITYQYGVP